MESNQPLDNSFNTSELGITSDVKSFLAETARWANFIAIVGFVLLGLLVLAGIFFGTMLGALAGETGMPGGAGIAGGMMSAVNIILALIVFFPLLYLFRFAKNTKQALRSNDQSTLTSAFENLKSHYKFNGILMIIILGIYALGLVVAIFGVAFF